MMSFHQQKKHLYSEHPMLTLTSFIGPIALYLMCKESDLNVDIPPFNIELHVALFLKGRAGVALDNA
jgi:hypothetical protein